MPALQETVLYLFWSDMVTFPLTLFNLLALLLQTEMDRTFTIPWSTVTVRMSQHVIGKDGAPMVFIPPGDFAMGRDDVAPDEQPTHLVYQDAFYIDMHEITVAKYAKFLQSEDHDFPFLWNEARPSHSEEKPVIGVDWFDAAAYCHWAGKRLPTEAEWEKAARGTDGRLYPWGDETPSHAHANFGHESEKGYSALVKIGSFERGKSPYGVYDLAGSVWEWVMDRYDEHYYQHSPERNPRGPSTGSLRVLRGGAWNSPPDVLISSNRNAYIPSARRSDVGFRCAQDALK